MTISPALLDLLRALAEAEVEDYMTAQATPAYDCSPERSERPASDTPAQAA